MSDGTGWIELDKPASSPPKTPASDARAATEAKEREEGRMRRREELKREKLAAAEAGQRLEQLQALIGAAEQRKEIAAAEHSAAAAPLQAERRRLESEGFTETTEYAHTIDGIASLNEKLASIVSREDSRLEELQAERLAAATACGTSSINSELIQYGKPAWVREMRAWSNVCNNLGASAQRVNAWEGRILQHFAAQAQSKANELLELILSE